MYDRDYDAVVSLLKYFSADGPTEIRPSQLRHRRPRGIARQTGAGGTGADDAAGGGRRRRPVRRPDAGGAGHDGRDGRRRGGLGDARPGRRATGQLGQQPFTVSDQLPSAAPVPVTTVVDRMRPGEERSHAHPSQVHDNRARGSLHINKYI